MVDHVACVLACIVLLGAVSTRIGRIIRNCAGDGTKGEKRQQYSTSVNVFFLTTSSESDQAVLTLKDNHEIYFDLLSASATIYGIDAVNHRCSILVHFVLRAICQPRSLLLG